MSQRRQSRYASALDELAERLAAVESCSSNSANSSSTTGTSSGFACNSGGVRHLVLDAGCLTTGPKPSQKKANSIVTDRAPSRNADQAGALLQRRDSMPAALQRPPSALLPTVVLGAGLPPPTPDKHASTLHAMAAGRLQAAGSHSGAPLWSLQSREPWGSAASSRGPERPQGLDACQVSAGQSGSSRPSTSSSASRPSTGSSSLVGSHSTTELPLGSCLSSRSLHLLQPGSPSRTHSDCTGLSARSLDMTSFVTSAGCRPHAGPSMEAGVPSGSPDATGRAPGARDLRAAATAAMGLRRLVSFPAAAKSHSARSRHTTRHSERQRLLGAVGDPDPASWLPRIHPAVGAALSLDLLPSKKQLAQQQLAVQQQAPPKQQQQQQQQGLLLQAPAFPGTNPTLAFAAPPLPASLAADQQGIAGAAAALADAASAPPQAEAAAAANDVAASPDEQSRRQQGEPAAAWQLRHATVRVKYAGIANQPVKKVVRCSGLKATEGSGWLLMWGSPQAAEVVAGMGPLQRINHFPGTYALGRKDNLYKHVATMRRLKGQTFDIVPRFFIMPRDLKEFHTDVLQHPGRMYIQKPVASSRGRGIRMVKDPSAVDKSLTNVLIQHYISNPLLIHGHKFDLRIYVAVTCIDPLRVYVYEEGLVRFAAQPYSTSRKSLGKRCCHLTNYSLNKKTGTAPASPKWQQGGASRAPAASGDGFDASLPADTAAEQQQQRQQQQQQDQAEPEQEQFDAGAEPSEAAGGLKWSLKQLRQHLERRGMSWQSIWQQVQDIAAKALIAAEPALGSATRLAAPHRNNCFEVFGMDVLLDDAGRAWLIEVNTSPALNADSPLDWRIKTSMIADLLTMVGLTPFDAHAMEQEQERQRKERLQGLPSGAGGSGSRGGGGGSRSEQGGGAKAALARCNSAQMGAAPSIRSVQEAQAMKFEAVAAAERLPDVVRETVAEAARRRGWQPVLPCPQQPSRYDMLLGLFSTQRMNNVLVRRFYQHCHA